MKTLTLKDIKEMSQPHPLDSVILSHMSKARQYKKDFGQYQLSIVGGAQGLYGDFIKDFEVAVIDRDSGNFVTHMFSDRAESGGVLSYANIHEINQILKKIVS
jgi:hypothetical protein